MKKKILQLAAWIFISQFAYAQEEEGVDLLKAPSSPAAQLLNIAPNTIEKPTDLSSVWLSVTNNTEGLSKFPTNYALDLSPASLFDSKIITLRDLQTCNIRNVMWQSLVISTGIKQEEDTLNDRSFYKAAIGIKFSIIRAEWSEKTFSRYNEIRAIQKQITALNEGIDDELEEDPVFKDLLAKRKKITDKKSKEYKEADEKVEKRKQEFLVEKRLERKEKHPELQNELKKKAREFHIERIGPFLDFSGGFSAQFPTNKLNYSIGDRAGAWLTGGYDGGEKKLSFLGIVRYLYQPETIYADPTGTIPSKNISTLDFGARLLFATSNDQFNLSFESIYRSVLTKSVIDPSWKLNFSAEYDLGFNKKISISFGRDFDGMISKGGNLIAALNLVTGFGNKKGIE